MLRSTRGAIHRWLLRNLWAGAPIYELIRLSRYRSPAVQLLKRLQMGGLKPKTVLDVGANRAEWSKHAAKVFPDAVFTLVEPVQEYGPILDRFLEGHPGSTRLEAALGSAVGTVDIIIDPGLVGSSLLAPTQDGHVRQVEIQTLDGLIENGRLETPDLVKIDVQGAELDVLNGARRCLAKGPVVIVEVSLSRFYPLQPLASEVITFLANEGYVLFDAWGLIRRDRDTRLLQMDVCLCREDSDLRRDATWS